MDSGASIQQPNMIDVIVPTWNRNDVLPRCLASITGAASVIVVDDGSDVRPNPENASVVRIAHTGLPGKVKNIGVRIGNAEYACVVDSDDYLLPNALAKIQAFIDAEHPDVLMTFQCWLEKDGSLYPSGIHLATDPYRMHQLVVFKRSLWKEVGGWPDNFTAAVDSEFYARLWKVAKVVTLPVMAYVKDMTRMDSISMRLNAEQKKQFELNVKRG